MRQLCGMTPEELARLLTEMGEKSYRATQIFSWITLGRSIDEMTNIPKALRERLSQDCTAIPLRIREVFASKKDETKKLLYELDDGNLIEGVLMHHSYGDTLCLSTQVGCRMGCRFCASTLDGKVRDLTPGEMLGEVLLANRLLSEENRPRLTNLVLMGSGEPLDNYRNTVCFLRLVHDERGLGISYRSISLSTCGIVPGILALAQEDMPVTLCISLHAPNDEIRAWTMPVAKAYPMDVLMDACRSYVAKTGRRAVFEYTLIRGVNDAPEHADELAGRLRGLQAHVNLIPLNPVPEREYERPTREGVRAFRERLERDRVSVTVRLSMGSDIEGACGQLRRRVMRDSAKEN